MSSSAADEIKMEGSDDTHPPIVRSLEPLYADVPQAQARSERTRADTQRCGAMNVMLIVC